MKEYATTTGQAVDGAATVKDSLTVQPDTFALLPLHLVVPSLTNPRKTFRRDRMDELVASIKASGVHQPVLVRPLPGSRVQDTFDTGQPGMPRPTHEIVAGERRYRASVEAGLPTIPALIRPLTDAQVLEIQLVENLQRDDLTELEEAEGYERLMQSSGITADAVAAKIGKIGTVGIAGIKQPGAFVAAAADIVQTGVACESATISSKMSP